MVEENAAGIPELITTVKDIAKAWWPAPSSEGELWFRGQPESRYDLVPGLYRVSNAPFHYSEESLFEEFKSYGAQFVDQRIKTEWDWYFLAQHHRLPTRLLDWTLNPLAAVYFSLCETFETGDRRNYDAEVRMPVQPSIYDDDSPAVWVLDAASLNRFAGGPGSDYIITPGGPVSDGYLPSAVLNQSPGNRYPLAVLPPYTNSRIVAQHGVFTLHGHDNGSIDSLATSSSPATIRLARIKLDRANLAHTWEDLELLGIDRGAMFPELDSVVYCIKWYGQNP